MRKLGFRQLLFWLFAIAFAWLILDHLSELTALGQTLVSGQWQWVLLAAGLQFLYYVIIAAQYEAGFAVVELGSDWHNLLPLVFAALFVNATAPVGGAAGVALFVDDATRRGYAAGRATVGFLLVFATTLGTFSLLLLLGLADLHLTGQLAWFMVVAALMLYLYTVALSAPILLGHLRPGRLEQLLQALQGAVGRVGRLFGRELLPAGWAGRYAGTFNDAATLVARHRHRLTSTLLAATASHLVAIASLAILFLAFSVWPTIGVLMAGYTMTVLFTIVSPTPNGAGVVEVLLPSIYDSLGVPLAPATAVTLSYRALNYWLPLLLGFFMLRRLHLFRPAPGTPHRHLVWPPAILTGLMGVLNLLSVASPSLAMQVAPLGRLSPLAVERESNLPAVLAGILLLTLGYGLARRKRLAWLLTLVVLVVSAITHLWRGPDYPEATIALLLAVYLIAQRQLFVSPTPLFPD